MMSMQGGLSVERMCYLAQVSRAGLYRSFQEPAPAEEEMKIRSAIQQTVLKHRRRYGYRRVTAELRRQGIHLNHKRVARMMREDNLLAVPPRAFLVTTDSQHPLEVYLNLAARMKLTGPNQLWVADITYIRLRSEFVYLAVILDAFSRKVVGWALARTFDRRFAVSGSPASASSAQPSAGLGSSFRSRPAVCLRFLRRGAAPVPHATQHESARQSLRQCYLRELHENPQARRNSCQRLPQS